jgi:hypothetical protein
MLQHVTESPLTLITAAVTPAVMISASAILISGISSKHSSTSDRLRSLTSEHRQPGVSEHRKHAIEKQCALFMRRLRLITIAHLFLYAATGCFAVMVLLISSPGMRGWAVLLPLFIVAMFLLLGGVVSEMLELRLAMRTLALETVDLSASPRTRQTPGA